MYRSRVIFERHQEQTIAFVRMAFAIATGTHQELLTLPQKVLLPELKKGPPSLTPQRRKFPPACVTWWTHSVTDIALRPRHARNFGWRGREGYRALPGALGLASKL